MNTDASPAVLREAGITVEWQTIDPTAAAALLEGNALNRGLRPAAVAAYARDMHAGRWQLTGEAVKISSAGELLDGQHRLEAIRQAGVPVRLLVVSGLAPETRNVIDTGTPRTGADALRMAGVGGSSAEALAAAARVWHLYMSGRLKTYGNGMAAGDRLTHSELLEVVTARPDLRDAVRDASRDYPRTGIPAGPGAAAMTILADVDAADAERFFDALAGYQTDGAKDPRAVLLVTMRDQRALKQQRRPGLVVGLVFAAWNAWRDGQKISSLPTHDRRGRPLPIQEPA